MCYEPAADPDEVVFAAPRPDPGRETPDRVPLEPVDAVTLTTLVDNQSDLLLAPQGPVKRTGMREAAAMPRPSAGVLDVGETYDVPLAEHGFSMLVTVTKGGRDHRLLFDAGMTPDGMVGNMRRLGVAPDSVEAVVLSHGHADHVTGLDGLVRAVGVANTPLVVHPGVWTGRRLAVPGTDPLRLPAPSRGALAGAGFEIVERAQPSLLFGRSVLITGEIDRVTPFERGMPAYHQALVGDRWEHDALVQDDQALVLNVRGHGLVVVTGCGHAGIVNIVRYARRLTGESRVAAVIGGFHLSGPAFEPIIEPTVGALAELAPEVLIPAHCTGWRAAHALAARLPDAFVPNAVGSRLELGAAA